MFDLLRKDPPVAGPAEAADAPAREPGPVRCRRAAPDAGFERWLGRRLRDAHAPVLDEPLPDDLARLLERFDRDGRGDPPPAGGRPAGPG